MDTFDEIKIMNCSPNDNIGRLKMQTTNLGKIFASHKTDKTQCPEHVNIPQPSGE